MIKVSFKNFVVSSMLNLLLVTVPPISVKQNKLRERAQVYRNVDYCVVSSHTGCKEMTDMPASNQVMPHTRDTIAKCDSES